MAERSGRDLKDLSLLELEELARRIEAEIASRRSSGGGWLGTGARGALVERNVRYCNPENPAETWSGRGKRPAWVEAALQKGASLADLIVPGDSSES